MKIKRALLSVSDKTGIVELAKALYDLGVELISTGGTMKAIQAAGIPVTYVSEVTGFPEIMDGRVKTLNPYIHGGILAVRDNPAHQEAMSTHNIIGIDLVAVNLYPFSQAVAKPGATLEDAVENIDIGGPAMIRAAAKNFNDVTVIVNPERYAELIDQLTKVGEVELKNRMLLAQEAFNHTAAYDAHISRYLGGQLEAGLFPETVHLVYERTQQLRYGENPHQAAAFYREQHYSGPGVASARQLNGKELSFNNIVDVEAAYALAADFSQPAAAIIKHTNPCGTGIGATLAEAYQKAYQADPVSAYGGIVGVNREVDRETAQLISEIFIEVVIAPAFSQQALDILTHKKNIRLLAAALPQTDSDRLEIKSVAGGVLLQQVDMTTAAQSAMKVVTKRQPTANEWEQLLFAWKVVKHVKSNAIVIANDNKTLGVGAGQMNRVGAAGIALAQAGRAAQGAVLASDAFFPFADTVNAAAEAGVTAIIQPGGSVHDQESIKAADEHGIVMVFTGMRHFKH